MSYPGREPRPPVRKRAGRPCLGQVTAAAAFIAASFATAGFAVRASSADRPGLAEAEQAPDSMATCESLEGSLSGFQPPRARVDLWVAGPLTLVHTDGVLWYLAVCSSPGIRVMCITYADNGMKSGEHVTVRGALDLQYPRHVVLDPCLATRA
jgi:hypothetical protein